MSSVTGTIVPEVAPQHHRSTMLVYSSSSARNERFKHSVIASNEAATALGWQPSLGYAGNEVEDDQRPGP